MTRRTGQRSANSVGSRRKNKSRHNKLLNAAYIVVIIALVVSAATYGYLRYRVGQLNSLSLPSLSASSTSKPMNILLVGSDSRKHVKKSQVNAFGTTAVYGGQRSDVTMILHLDPSTHKASLLSIPRDLFVNIAGTNHKNRVNAAYNAGPEKLIQTIQQDFGIPINHYVEVNFSGFQGVVNALGGVSLYFPYPVYDHYSGLNIPKAGCTKLNGFQALAVVRSRHYHYYKNGYWHYDPTSDFGRIKRQHMFLKVLFNQIKSQGLTNPIKANALIGSLVHYVTIDSGFSLTTMAQLLTTYSSLNPNNVPTYTLPTKIANNYHYRGVNYGDVLLPSKSADKAMIKQFLATPKAKTSSKTTTPAISPSSVSTQILNGSGIAGQASQVANQLKSDGFKISGTGNASSFNYTKSVIQYLPGNKAKAKVLQSKVQGSTTLKQVSSLNGSSVALITGSDFSGIKTSTSTPSTPSTTGSAAITSNTSASSYPSFDPRAC